MGGGPRLGHHRTLSLLSIAAIVLWEILPSRKPQMSYWLTGWVTIVLTLSQYSRCVDARSIPMLGCSLSRLSSSRTTHAQADPTRAYPQNRTLTAHADGRILDEVSWSNEHMRSHGLRHVPGSLFVASPHNLKRGT